MSNIFNLTFSTMQDDKNCFAECYGSVGDCDFNSEQRGDNLYKVMSNVLEDVEKQILSSKMETVSAETQKKLSDIDAQKAKLEAQLQELEENKKQLTQQFERKYNSWYWFRRINKISGKEQKFIYNRYSR